MLNSPGGTLVLSAAQREKNELGFLLREAFALAAFHLVANCESQKLKLIRHQEI